MSMGDIKLVHSGNGHYDWNITVTGVETVTGADAVISKVKHALLLRENELKQELYENKGCNTSNLFKLKLTNETLDFINEYIKQVLIELPEIKEANVESESNSPGIVDTTLNLILDTGEEVVIDGI